MVFAVGKVMGNVIGCFLISYVMSLSEYWGFFDRETRIFLTIGILGSFTTMSTFSYEAFKMLEKGDLLSTAIYVIGTIGLCFLAVYLGRVMGGLR